MTDNNISNLEELNRVIPETHNQNLPGFPLVVHQQENLSIFDRYNPLAMIRRSYNYNYTPGNQHPHFRNFQNRNRDYQNFPYRNTDPQQINLEPTFLDDLELNVQNNLEETFDGNPGNVPLTFLEQLSAQFPDGLLVALAHTLIFGITTIGSSYFLYLHLKIYYPFSRFTYTNLRTLFRNPS
jgi:hypothetical protein